MAEEFTFQRPLYDDWCVEFLDVLRRTGSVRSACDATGVPRGTALAYRRANAVFRLRWHDALDEAVDELEVEARSRAIGGSDALLMFLLKAQRPAVYGTQRVEINHVLLRQLADELGIDPIELEAETRLLMEGRTSVVDALYARDELEDAAAEQHQRIEAEADA